MEIIADILLPVFGIAALGYGAARFGWFSESHEAGVGAFVFNFAVPFFLFQTITTTTLPDTIPWGLFASYYLPVGIVYAIGFVLGRWAFGRDFSGATLTGMGCAFSNTVLLGLPLVLLAYGDEGTLPFFLILAVHGLILFTGTTILMEVGRSSGASVAGIARKAGIGLAKNPLILGLVAGGVTNLSGIDVPAPVAWMAETMKSAVLPCALFVLGASLSRYGLAGRTFQSALQVGIKLAVMPALVFVLGTFVFDLNPLWVQVAVITAAQPTGVMVFVFASRYGTAQALATTSIFLSTVLSVFSSWAILWIFQATAY